MNDELKIQSSEFGIQNEEVSSLRAERSNLETNKIILQVLLAKFGKHTWVERLPRPKGLAMTRDFSKRFFYDIFF